jgi:hypothetical protein
MRIVYHNGEQVGRNNLDSGTTTGGTVAYSLLAVRGLDNAEESTFVPMPVSDELIQELHAGDNVIALEVHQTAANSSDLVMDLELIAQFHPPVKTSTASAAKPTVGSSSTGWTRAGTSNPPPTSRTG